MHNEFFRFGITDLAEETNNLTQFRWTNRSVIGPDSQKLPWKDKDAYKPDKEDKDCVVSYKNELLIINCHSSYRYD